MAFIRVGGVRIGGEGALPEVTTELSLTQFLGRGQYLPMEMHGVPDFCSLTRPRTLSEPTAGQTQGQSRESLALDTGDVNESQLLMYGNRR